MKENFAQTMQIQSVKVGRPRAKKSNPDFRSTTVWIKKDTHIQVKTKLLPEKKEFSILVQELLDKWISQNQTIETSEIEKPHTEENINNFHDVMLQYSKIKKIADDIKFEEFLNYYQIFHQSLSL